MLSLKPLFKFYYVRSILETQNACVNRRKKQVYTCSYIKVRHNLYSSYVSGLATNLKRAQSNLLPPEEVFDLCALLEQVHEEI
mmetsp:Transcript_7226/g.9150  ORF Transcript_7226/g.9150 Transcript_7226/m.9150 type:complete len:83 (-) Transcript_7226:236-484(-)